MLGEVLGVGLGAGVALGVVELPDEDEEPVPVELEPEVLPEPLVLPEVLPYSFTQSSRSVPVLPMHWLGVADASLLELPLALPPVEPDVDGLLLEPEPAEPEPIEPLAPEPLEPLAPEPVALGLLVDEPLLPALPELPEVCAHDAVARPSIAAATAAVSVFAFTIDLS